MSTCLRPASEAERSSSIFNFDQIAVFKGAVTKRQIQFLFSCLLIAAIPLCLFDRIDVPVLGAIELIVILLVFHRNRDYRSHLAIFLAALALFCAVGEIYFRLRYFGRAGLSFSQCRPAGYGHPWSNFEYDETTYTGVKPNTTLYFKGRLFTVNAAGFRGKNYPFEKDKNVFRIVLAGASATIGSGLADEEILTSILEHRLNAAGLPNRVEIINLSISGSQYGDMLHVLREFGLRYDPDILMFLANETLIPAGDMLIKPRKVHKINKQPLRLAMNQKYDVFSSRFFFASLMAAFREGNITRAGWEGLALPKSGRRSQRDENLIGALRQLNNMKGDGRIVLYLLRPILDLKNRNHDAPYRDKLRALASRFKMEIADAYDQDFSPFNEMDLIVYPGDKHPNAIAQRLYADGIYPVLLRMIREEEQASTPDRNVPDKAGTASAFD